MIDGNSFLLFSPLFHIIRFCQHCLSVYLQCEIFIFYIMQDFVYIMFPLPFVQRILTDRKNISGAFEYGIYKVAMFQKVSEYNAYRQIVYCYFNVDNNKIDSLTDYLIDELNKLDYMYDDDYRGFTPDGQSFAPEEIISKLIEIGENNREFHNRVIEFYKLRQVRDTLGFTFSIRHIIKVHDSFGDYTAEPLVSVKKEIMIDFYQNRDTKSEQEWVLFAMFMGIKSIIGNKDYCATTADMIKCRMVGAKNKDNLATILKKNAACRYFYDTYTTRRKYEKLMMELEKYGYIKSCISYNRRTYISCKLSLGQLEQVAAEGVVNSSETLQMQRYHEAKKAARIRISERLKFVVNGH